MTTVKLQHTGFTQRKQMLTSVWHDFAVASVVVRITQLQSRFVAYLLFYDAEERARTFFCCCEIIERISLLI